MCLCVCCVLCVQPPAAPTSRNYAEMREKLRLRLTKRKEEQQPKKEELVLERDTAVADHRKVEDLLQFINSADSKPASSSKAAKRARHKQKKVAHHHTVSLPTTHKFSFPTQCLNNLQDCLSSKIQKQGNPRDAHTCFLKTHR